ncbi:MAG: radical SAM protein [Deltaproteobacteria bacterium]|nr:radical SAM protein [Deltaproteobacteria bacterium]
MLSGSSPLPGVVVLNVTDACNLRCPMCYAWGDTGCYVAGDSPKKPKVLDLEIALRLIKELAPRQPAYSLFGGEPLSYRPLPQLLEAVKSAGSWVETPTNGTLLEKHAAFLVESGLDSVRVSLDGPRAVNDRQRGPGSFDDAVAGLEALLSCRARAGSATPRIGVICTVTPENQHTIAPLFLEALDLAELDAVEINMQLYITPEMGDAYARMLLGEHGIQSDCYWKGVVREVASFDTIDVDSVSAQIASVRRRVAELGRAMTTMPRITTPRNLKAHFTAQWFEMEERVRFCPVPWSAVDITAEADVAPCHAFYDLVVGNLKEQAFTEIWNGEAMRKVRRRVFADGLLSVCQGCCALYATGAKRRPLWSSAEAPSTST